jgi:hypothetical protein
MGEMRNAYNVLIRKCTGKRHLARPRHRWENCNIKMGLGENRCEDVDWIHQTQDRDKLQTLVNGNEPSGSIRVGELLNY